MSKHTTTEVKKSSLIERNESSRFPYRRVAAAALLGGIVVSSVAEAGHDRWQEHQSIEQAHSAMDQLEIKDLWDIDIAGTEIVDNSNEERVGTSVMVDLTLQPTDEYQRLLDGDTGGLPERFLNYADNDETTPDTVKKELEDKNISEVFWTESVELSMTSPDIPKFNGDFRLSYGEAKEDHLVRYEIPMSTQPYPEDSGEVFVDLNYTLEPRIIGDNGIVGRENSPTEPIGSLKVTIEEGKIVGVTQGQ